jgi:hypothetical protein
MLPKDTGVFLVETNGVWTSPREFAMNPSK